jgi:hypothetical protein
VHHRRMPILKRPVLLMGVMGGMRSVRRSKRARAVHSGLYTWTGLNGCIEPGRHIRRAGGLSRCRSASGLFELDVLGSERDRCQPWTGCSSFSSSFGLVGIVRLSGERRWGGRRASFGVLDVDRDLLGTCRWGLLAGLESELDLGLRGLLHRRLGFSQLLFEAFLTSVSVKIWKKKEWTRTLSSVARR